MMDAPEIQALGHAISIAAALGATALALGWVVFGLCRPTPGISAEPCRVRVRVRVRRRPAGLRSRRLAFVGGLALSLAFPAGAGASRSPLRDAPPAQQPWQPADGDPPPPPSAGAEVFGRGGSPRPPWRESAHPAIHRSKHAPTGPLFPRATAITGAPRGAQAEGRTITGHDTSAGSHSERDDVMLSPEEPIPIGRGSSVGQCSAETAFPDPMAEKRACMRRHPAGKGIRRADSTGRRHNGRVHEVQPGESLWAIAAAVLDTDDQARIARYWPRIHRANRDIIGQNPDLIFAGQRLVLPPESR